MKGNLAEYILTGVKFLFGVLGVVFFVLILMNADSVGERGIILDQEGYESLWSHVGGAYMITYIAIGICAAAWAVFGLFQIVTNLKQSLPVLIGLVAFAIIGFISWSMSNGNLLQTSGMKEPITESASHWSGAGLQALYILLGLTVAVALFAEVKKLIR